MRSGWTAGVVFLYLGIWWYAMLYAQQTTMSSSIVTNFGWLVSPQVNDFTGSVLSQASAITMVGSYLVNFIGVCLLWFPGLWSGALVWVYLFVCLPISISMITQIMTTWGRGVGSS